MYNVKYPSCLAIFGQLGNGKSTLAEMISLRLLHKHSWSIGITGFAYPIKAVAADLIGCDVKTVNEFKSNGIPPKGWNKPVREFLQWLGDGARQFNPHIWIEKVIGPNIIMDDGRYRNEAEAVHKVCGFNVLIVRPDKINDSTHASESWVGELARHVCNKSIDEDLLYLFDAVIINDESMEQLEVHASVIAEMFYNHVNNLTRPQ